MLVGSADSLLLPGAIMPTCHNRLDRHAHADPQLVDVGDAGPQERREQRGEDGQAPDLADIVLRGSREGGGLKVSEGLGRPAVAITVYQR